MECGDSQYALSTLGQILLAVINWCHDTDERLHLQVHLLVAVAIGEKIESSHMRFAHRRNWAVESIPRSKSNLGLYDKYFLALSMHGRVLDW